MELVWWHWIVLGMVLALLELTIPTFFILWFGIGAMLVGVIMLLVPLSTAAQLTLWAIASSAMTMLWFKYFKLPDRTKAGIAKEALIGETGMVTKEVSELKKGEIRFQKPILGCEVWPVIADEVIKPGERAVIIDVMGQTLKIAKKN
jgi:membrane protein implicated in regulation of membrane protease activity